jgi:DNA mismatch repair ATPase MutL
MKAIEQPQLLDTAVSIPTHSAVAVELVFNALDSGADSVTITLDLWRNQIRCRDNGHGISKHELPNIFKLDQSSQESRNRQFWRNGRTIAKISQIADVAILTRTSGDEVPRRANNQKSQYIAPLFAPGTEVVISSIFDSIPVRVQQMATATWKREELQKIRILINTTLLSFPDISVTIDLGNTKIDLPKCRTTEERWKQITGTHMLVDSDGRTTQFRSASSLGFPNIFAPFVVNKFPIDAVTLDGIDISANPKAVTSFNGRMTNLA